MPLKILVPVLPSERFYDAVVAAGDLLAEQGGTLTFVFTTTRPPPMTIEDQPSQTESAIEVPPEGDYDADLPAWQDAMVSGLGDARELLFERGIDEEQVSYRFADTEGTAAEIIADEAAAGSYDMVVLSRGEIAQMPDDTPGDSPSDIAGAVSELRDDGVRLLVT